MKKFKYNSMSLIAVVLFTGLSISLSSCDDEKNTVTGITPKATSITPNEHVRAGQTVTIEGSELDHVKEVRFGTLCLVAKSEFDEASDASKLILTLPAEAPDGDVYLIADDETVPNQLIGEITVVLPTITGFSPDEVTGGTEITVTGTDLDLVEEILIGTVKLTDITLNEEVNATSLTAICPKTVAGGFLKLVAKNEAEILYTSQAFENIIPIITSADPTTLSTGLIITLQGEKLGAVEKVLIGEVELTDVVANEAGTELTALCPKGVSTGLLSVITRSGIEVKTTWQIDIIADPSVTAVSNSIPGGLISITGENLLTIYSLIFADNIEVNAADFVLRTDEEIQAIVPVNAKLSNASKLELTYSGGLLTSPNFVLRTYNANNYMMFDFDKISYGWGDGNVTLVTGKNSKGAQILRTDFNGQAWFSYLAQNPAGRGDQLPSTALFIDGWSLALDVKVANVSGGLRLKFRLGDYWAYWTPEITSDWQTVVIPMVNFKDGNGDGPTSITLKEFQTISEWGLASGWADSDAAVCNLELIMDNVRFAPNHLVP
jgi:hypothetical protein